MLKNVKKLLRSVARASKGSEVEPGGIFGEVYIATISGTFGAFAVGLAVGPVGAVAGAVAAGAAAFFGTHMAKLDTASMREVTKGKINDDIVGVGIRRRISHLKWGQEKIISLTSEFKTVAQMPPKVEAKVQAYLQDAAEFAVNVRVYDLSGVEQDKIIFTREVFNAQGQVIKVPVGAVKTETGLRAQQQPASVAHVLPAPAQQKVKALKPLQYTNKP